jgi:HK97 family phage prohead protease
MRHKTFQLAETKADDSGSFTALASVFGNVDLGGDRMMPGSFSKTLERWRESGDPIPVILSHQWDDPMAMVGKADPMEVVETERGLVVKGQLDIEHNAVAQQVHRLMRDRLLKGWSFGYSVPEGGEKRAKDGANEVFEVDLIEVGPTLRGMNPEAQLQAVKSALEESSAAPAAKEEPPPAEVEDERDEGAKSSSPRTSDPAADPCDIARIDSAL